MHSPFSPHSQHTHWFVAAIAICALSGPLHAKETKTAPTLSGPSVIKVDESASVSGHGLPVNTAVTVVVQSPTGQTASFSAVSDANGSLNHSFVGSAAGKWSVVITNSSGRRLANTSVNFVP